MPDTFPEEKLYFQNAKESFEKDLTNKEDFPLRNSTIEELKSKLATNELTTMIPDCQKSDPEKQTKNSVIPLLNENGLVIPKKPPNPVKESFERLNLHKEMLFNQKIGKNVLNQKSELQKALDKQKEIKAKRELENHIATKTPEFERVIADMAKRRQTNEDDNNKDNKVINKEFLEARMKLKNRKEDSN